VHVCSNRRFSLSGASRYAAIRTLVPDPLRFPADYADAVAALARRVGARVILPVTDASILALLPARSILHPAVLPFPDEATCRLVANKATLLEVAAGLGIPVPVQTTLLSPADGPGVVAGLRFPVVLKPSRSVAESDHGRAKFGVLHAANEQGFLESLDRMPEAAFPVLVQERVVGPGLGVFLLRWDDAVLAHFAHRRVREKPPSGGVSVRSVSVPAEPALLAQAESLLRQVGWNGVAMVEFKRGTDGRAYLMEINGRFWGSLQLAIDSGVDFPRLLVEAAMGRTPSPVDTYRVGVRRRWWWGEVDHLLARLRHRPEVLALPPGSPSSAAVAFDLLTAPFRGVRGEVCRLSDPAPALREAFDWLRGR
jgi:hypothetical protein